MKKHLAAGLCLALLLCLLPTGAAAATVPWDGTARAVPTTYSAGENTISISTPAELAWVSAYSNGVTTEKPSELASLPVNFQGYTLLITADIDLGNKQWTPIKDFAGKCVGADAQMKTISNLYVNVPGNFAGLFGKAYRADGGYEFENLRIQNANVTGYLYVGALVGNGYTCDFNNCRVDTAVLSGNQYVGGITGQGYSKINNCHVSGLRATSKVGNSGEGDDIGGIIGMGGEGATVVTNCTVTGSTLSGARQAGGIVGTLLYGNSVENCTISDSSVSASGFLTARASGIIGEVVGQSGRQVVLTGNRVENNVTITVSGFGAKRGWLVGSSRGVTAATASQYITESGNTGPDSEMARIIYGA